MIPATVDEIAMALGASLVGPGDKAAVVTALSEMCRVAPVPPAGLPTEVVVTTRGSVVGRPFLDRLPPEVRVTRLDSGHVVYVDNPDGTAAVVREFLQRVRDGRRSN